VLVLIDESGDPGFKLAKGSTSHFVVAMVIFQDFEEAERTSAAIETAMEELRVKPEFKFSKCSDAVRDGFFQAVAPFKFIVRAMVVDKAKVYSKNLREDTERFYNYFVQMLMRHDNDALDGANVKIDGSGDREFKNALAAYLRHQLGDGKIAKMRFADSRRDRLVQLADMVAGAIARSYRHDDRTKCNRWRTMFASKIRDVWEFR